MRRIRLGSAVGLAAVTVSMLVFTGCSQRLSPHTAAGQGRADGTALSIWRGADQRSLATVHCSGGLACRFTALNEMQLLDHRTGLPSELAHKAAVFRYESMHRQAHAPYHLAVVEGMHEVRLQFYPVTLERAEQFTLIHQFKAGREYQLNLFRDRQTEPNSLLAMAAPDPLCVDLSENKRVIRRFCRPFDPQTGLGEFIESKLPQQAS